MTTKPQVEANIQALTTQLQTLMYQKKTLKAQRKSVEAQLLFFRGAESILTELSTEAVDSPAPPAP